MYIFGLFMLYRRLQETLLHSQRFHAANILLKTTKQQHLSFSSEITVPLHGLRPWIGDFEKSIIGTRTRRDYEDFRYDISKLFFLLPSFVAQIDRCSIMNIPTFFQTAADICSDDARSHLSCIIDHNLNVLW